MNKSDYAIMVENKLIDEFKATFLEKVGYLPVVITRLKIDGIEIKYVSLDTLKSYFTPFLPMKYGERVALDAKHRYRELVDIRTMYCFLAKQMKYPYATIGQSLKGQDHTTVIHAVGVFKNQMETSPAFREHFLTILEYINSIQQNTNESPILESVQDASHQSEPALLP